MRVEFKWHFSIRFIKTTDPQQSYTRHLNSYIDALDAEIAKLSKEGMPQREIAKKVGINQGSVSRRLKALKKKGRLA